MFCIYPSCPKYYNLIFAGFAQFKCCLLLFVNSEAFTLSVVSIAFIAYDAILYNVNC